VHAYGLAINTQLAIICFDASDNMQSPKLSVKLVLPAAQKAEHLQRQQQLSPVGCRGHPQTEPDGRGLANSL